MATFLMLTIHPSVNPGVKFDWKLILDLQRQDRPRSFCYEEDPLTQVEQTPEPMPHFYTTAS